jgi:phage gp16-like protein
LRASWRFAHDMARRFGQELLSDRTAEFLKKLVKKF